MNCSAPDTGNMEVLERVGTKEQKEKWLKPLLAGEIRSAYAMTEPNVASSDAKNISTTAKLVGDEWVINGEKYYISGAGDPRCKIMITMVKTNPDAPPKNQQSQILVPIDTPGVEILGPMTVFGHDHAPRGHMHIKFDNVRVPKANMLLGEGRGFEISQVRLGPGRIHHCMRTIGKAEKALDLMVKRGLVREAFGKKLVHLGGNLQIIAQARCEIEAMRLMVLKAAKAMDVLGNKEARVWVSMVKAMVPERTCRSSTRRSRCTAPPAFRSGRRCRKCTPTCATSASPTAPMKCTGWWWAATSCSSTETTAKHQRHGRACPGHPRLATSRKARRGCPGHLREDAPRFARA